jgi:hypothetical protein
VNYKLMIMGVVECLLVGEVASAATPVPSIDDQIATLCSRRFDRPLVKSRMVVATAATRAEDAKESKVADKQSAQAAASMLAYSFLRGDNSVVSVEGATPAWAVGVIKDAAEAGDADACIILAYCYRHGIEVGQDMSAANDWERKAVLALCPGYYDLSSAKQASEVWTVCYVQKMLKMCRATHFGILEGVNLDCAKRVCSGCGTKSRKPLCGDDPIVIVKKNGGGECVAHAACLDCMLGNLRKTAERQYVSGHALKIVSKSVDMHSRSKSEEILF